MNYIRGIKLREMPAENSYLSELSFIQQLGQLTRDDFLSFDKPVTFFVGENGTGKSTLLEAIAVGMGFNPEGGSRAHSFSTKDTHSDLNELLTVIKSRYPQDGYFLRAESFYNSASYLDQTSSLVWYGGRSFHEQSHGEAFLALVRNRFSGHGIYLLDEPEAALSPQRLLNLITLIDETVNRDSQFIIATHSPILMAYPNADILQFSESGIRKVNYQETEHYIVTKNFINNPDEMLRYLLSEDSQ